MRGSLLPLVLLAACRAEAPAKDGADGRDLDTACVPEAEVPYDGVDQDCDGADLTDADADGHDAEVAGGADCDDAAASVHPGAPEVPYDGIDQDCDGADITDVDGDGVAHDEDCDDADATAFPGGTESRGDGADNDCDGRTDEYVTCWDGSGDFLGVQEGVDGTPDGGTLEICSGTYEETVTIEDRVITVEGEDPLGVLISAAFTGDNSRPLSVEGASDVSVSNVALEGLGYCIHYLTDTAPLVLDSIDFSRCPQALDTAKEAAGIIVRRSYFVSNGINSIPLSGSSPVFDQNLVISDGARTDIGPVTGSHLSATNNLFVGGEVRLGGSTARTTGAAELVLVNNTFADLERLLFFVDARDLAPAPVVELTNNIMWNVRTVDGNESPLYYAWWEHPERSAYSVLPIADDNLIEDDGATVAEVWDATQGRLMVTESANAESAFLNGACRADPVFAYGSMGSYGLAATSPAIDAGSGAPDPDGTAADLGAFGGPAGDWWMEVPWPLP